jgi:hypothetical protein
MKYLGSASGHYERDSNKTFVLTIDDVILQPITIRGLELDCHVTAHLVRTGHDGPIEIAEIEYRTVYLLVQPCDSVEPINVRIDNQACFIEQLKAPFEKAIEKLAIAAAARSLGWEMKDWD